MTRQLLAGLALSLAPAMYCYGSPQQESRGVGADKQITIRVHNYADANLSVVRHAERAAEGILRRAGVQTVWAECLVGHDFSDDPICDMPHTYMDFVFSLLPRSMSDRFHLKAGVLGLAMEVDGKGFGSAASIFYDIVKEKAAHRREDLDQLLGAAMAHELGHLLLGTNSHSTSGLMSASWSRNQLVFVQQSGLDFSSADAERLRKAVLARRLAVLNAARSRESATAGRLTAPVAR